jgi:drug/metabolite transporter (DMT)-like permease
MPARPLPVLAALSAALAWGATFPILPGILRRVDPFQASAERYVATALILLGILAAREGRGAFALAGRGREVGLLGVVGFVGFTVFLLLGVRVAGAEHGALAVATVPTLAMLLQAARTRVMPPLVRIPFVAAAFCGVALVVTGGHGIRTGSALGDLSLLVGGLCWAAYTVGAGDLGGWSPLRFTTLTAAAGALGLVAVAALATLAGVSHVPAPADYAATAPGMAYFVVVGTVYAMFAWNTGVHGLGPQRTALFMNLVPVTTFAIATASGNVPAPLELAGGGLTVAALACDNVITSLRARRASRAASLAA